MRPTEELFLDSLSNTIDQEIANSKQKLSDLEQLRQLQPNLGELFQIQMTISHMKCYQTELASGPVYNSSDQPGLANMAQKAVVNAKENLDMQHQPQVSVAAISKSSPPQMPDVANLLNVVDNALADTKEQLNELTKQRKTDLGEFFDMSVQLPIGNMPRSNVNLGYN